MDSSPGAKAYSVELPYPAVCVRGQSLTYARMMLDNIGGANSEMSAVSLYLYNHLVTCEDEEMAYTFHRISMVEMHHLEIFATLARQLGENPRFWTQNGLKKVYWSPCFIRYSTRPAALLDNAISAERAAIQKYQRQLKAVMDTSIRENLQRIILDEELHIDILLDLQSRYAL